MLPTSLQGFSAHVHPPSETTGEQKHWCCDMWGSASRFDSTSQQHHIQTWIVAAFLLFISGLGFFFGQSGEGPCLYRSSYLKAMIINKAGSISSLIVDETPNHSWYHRTAISPVVPDRLGWFFFSTQSWVGQENTSDEPQLLLLCSKLPTDALGLPQSTNTSPTSHSPKVFCPSPLPPWLVTDSSSALGAPGLQKGRESWHWAKWSHQKAKSPSDSSPQVLPSGNYTWLLWQCLTL